MWSATGFHQGGTNRPDAWHHEPGEQRQNEVVHDSFFWLVLNQLRYVLVASAERTKGFWAPVSMSVRRQEILKY